MVCVIIVDVESKLLKARMRMQQKYVDQFYMLYDDFHITKLPLLPQEVNCVKTGRTCRGISSFPCV